MSDELEPLEILSRLIAVHDCRGAAEMRGTLTRARRQLDEARGDAARMRGALEAEQRTSATRETILNGEREHRYRLSEALLVAQEALTKVGKREFNVFDVGEVVEKAHADITRILKEGP